MKKILSTFAFFLFLMNSAQTPSSSKKWNDYYKRYEYLDSHGTLIAYEKYNEYKKQWEYFPQNDLDPAFPRKRKSVEFEYPTISNSEIEYTKTVQQQATAEKYRREAEINNANQKIVQKRINEIFNEINKMEINQDLKNKLINGMNSWIEYGNEHYSKLNNSDDVQKTISFYNGAFNDIQENLFYRNLSELDKLKFDTSLNNINEIIAETYRRIKALNITNTQKKKLFEDLDLYIDEGQNKFIQLENKELYIKAYNYYKDAYNYILNKNK